MRVTILAIPGLLLLMCSAVKAQGRLFASLESGPKLDRFIYINENSYQKSMYSLNKIWEVNLGFQHKRFSYEAGIFRQELSSPVFWFNYDNASVDPELFDANNPQYIGLVAIPFIISYDFLHRNRHYFIKPSMGLNLLITENYKNLYAPALVWDLDYSEDDFERAGFPTGNERTIASMYVTDRVNLSFESSIDIGYRIRNIVDLYIKLAFYHSMKVMIYNNYTHYTESEVITATNTYNGTSFSLQFGFRAYFRAE